MMRITEKPSYCAESKCSNFPLQICACRKDQACLVRFKVNQIAKQYQWHMVPNVIGSTNI